MGRTGLSLIISQAIAFRYSNSIKFIFLRLIGFVQYISRLSASGQEQTKIPTHGKECGNQYSPRSSAGSGTAAAAFGGDQVEDFDQDREGNGEIEIAAWDVEMQPIGDQRHPH